jgi:hypothetical protein
MFLKLAALGAVLITTACGASYSGNPNGSGNGAAGVNVQEPTSTVKVQPPTNTTEPTLTATSTEVPTATPTRDPNFKEWPASWFAGNFAIAQKGDPNVSMTTAPCVYSDELCVQAIDYCPEGTECVGYLVVSPIISFGFGSAPYSRSSGVVIGTKYQTTLWGGGDSLETFTPQGLFVTDKERELFLCTIGYRENYVLKSESLILVNQAVLDALNANGNGVFVAPIHNAHSLSQCGG